MLWTRVCSKNLEAPTPEAHNKVPKSSTVLGGSWVRITPIITVLTTYLEHMSTVLVGMISNHEPYVVVDGPLHEVFLEEEEPNQRQGLASVLCQKMDEFSKENAKAGVFGDLGHGLGR